MPPTALNYSSEATYMKRRYSFSRDVLVPYLVSKSDRRGSDFSNRQLAIFSGDVVGRSSVLDGWYAQDEISALLEFLAANAVDAYSGVCVDVGANVGSHSIPLANVFTRVIAIEPHPETYRLLHLNVERLNNVIALQLAISDTTGTELLTVPDNLHS
ncbi:MAG: FkbM family methyltransferase, partial [Actinobacteria bacterium]|nr:FkbM family methyltransferase [Actinomycetota bacterium]